MEDSNNPSFGFNADTGTYEHLLKAGIIVPTNVALQNAASIATCFSPRIARSWM